MYKYNSNTKMLHWVFLGAVVVLLFFITQLYLQLVIGIIALMLIKDNLKMYKFGIKVTPSKIEYYSGDKLDKEVSYKELEMITLTRKSKNVLILVTHDNVIHKLPKTLDNFDELLAQVLEYTKSNKKINIHESLTHKTIK